MYVIFIKFSWKHLGCFVHKTITSIHETRAECVVSFRWSLVFIFNLVRCVRSLIRSFHPTLARSLALTHSRTTHQPTKRTNENLAWHGMFMRRVAIMFILDRHHHRHRHSRRRHRSLTWSWLMVVARFYRVFLKGSTSSKSFSLKLARSNTCFHSTTNCVDSKLEQTHTQHYDVRCDDGGVGGGGGCSLRSSSIESQIDLSQTVSIYVYG